MPLHADFLRFFRREHGSVTIEAICFLVFLMSVAVSCFALFPIVKNGASGAIDNRTVIRNASLNESCSHTGLFPGQPITVGFREKSQVTIHCNMNINGETAVEDDQRFWTMLQAAGDAVYPNLNRAQEPVMAFSAVQSEQFSTFFGSPTSTSMIWFNNETFAPSNETWLFNVPRWAEGHDKVIWEHFTNRQKDLFPRVYPSAKTPSTGTASASNLEELEIDYASAVRPDFNITEELERITAVAATVDTGAVTTATETTVPTQVTASGTGNQPNAPPTSEGGDTGGAPASYATPPLDNLSNYMRETLASRIGTAQGVAEGAIGWVGDMVGGAATAVETVYEAGVVGLEEATGWIPDDYAASQQQDLVDRGTGILEAAQELMDDPAAVAEAFAEYYAAQYEHADALEAAYRAGEGDISLYQEAERIRARTTTELGIMGVETAATVVGVGAIAKGLRAARIADKLDGATPLAIALNGVRQTRLATEAVGDLSRQPGRTTPFDMGEVRTRTDELVEARNRDLDEDLAETPSNAPYDARAWRDYYDEFYEGNVTSTTVPPYNAKNVPLAGQRHPNTGVVFDQRGFPVFDDFTVYDTRFTGPEFRNASYQTQMRMGTRDLRTQIENNPQLRSQFNEAQLQAIQSGNAKIPGYTWHHHQDSGRMQLVDEDIHRNTGHIGGEAMSEGQ